MSFEDLLAQVDFGVRRTLGGDVIYTSGAGTAVTVRGVFDANYQLLFPDGSGVSSTGPAVFLRLADLPSSPVTDGSACVTRAGVVYRVREPKPDGMGGVLLLLHEA